MPARRSGPDRGTQDQFRRVGVALDQLPLIESVDDPARLLVVAAVQPRAPRDAIGPREQRAGARGRGIRRARAAE